MPVLLIVVTAWSTEGVMGFIRRKKQDADLAKPREGVPIDMMRYQDQIGEGTNPHLPHDGRYWMMMADAYDDEIRLLWEEAATYREARRALKNLADYCKVKPQRMNQGHVDDVDGLWGAQRPGRRVGLLSIWHPIAIGGSRRYRDIRQAVGLDVDPEPTGGDWDDPEWGRWWDRQVAVMPDDPDEEIVWRS
jgi:hypothetical protein